MEPCQLRQALLFIAGAKCGELEKLEGQEQRGGDNSSLLQPGSTSCTGSPAERLPFPGAILGMTHTSTVLERN